MNRNPERPIPSQAIAAQLEGGLADRVLELRQEHGNRIWLRVAPADLLAAGRLLVDELRARLATVSAVDGRDDIELTYHFALDNRGCVVNLRTRAGKPDPHLESLTALTAGAQWIEREIMELFACRFDGHPQPERLLLADDWPEGRHPMRRGGA